MDSKLRELENIFMASGELLFNPKKCFTARNDGYLECVGVGPFRYWFSITFLEVAMILLTSRGQFGGVHFYALAQMTTSFIRLIIVTLIWVAVGKLFRFDNIKPAVSILLFSTAIFSLIMYIFLIFPMYKEGLEISLTRTTTPEVYKEYVLLFRIVFVLMVTTPFYIALYISSSYKKSYIFSCIFIFMTLFIYSLLRPYTVIPLSDLMSDFIVKRPWAN